MNDAPDISGQSQCEAILKAERDSNVESEILASENAVIDRLLNRSLELQGAYTDLVKRLGNNPPALTAFLSTLLSSAAFWCPEKTAQAREERKKLMKVSGDISAVAHQLADLLETRSSLNNYSGFFSGDIYDVHSAVEAAARNHTRFQSFVQTEFHRLFAQYDLKYWPKLSDVIRAIGDDAGSAQVYASDALTDAGTQGPRASLADFFRSWFAAINQNTGTFPGFIPAGFRLSDESMASLASCALDLDPDDAPGADYVKRFRQRSREARLGGE